MGRRRGSERSLSGSVHELVVAGARGAAAARVAHSHSQSNLSDIPCRDPPLGTSLDEAGRAQNEKEENPVNVCPWETTVESTSALPEGAQADKETKNLEDESDISTAAASSPPPSVTEAFQKPESDTEATPKSTVKKGSICLCEASSSLGIDTWPPECGFSQSFSRKNSLHLDSGSSSSDVSAAVDVSEKLRKSCAIQLQQHTDQDYPSSSGFANPPLDVEKNIKVAPAEEKVIARIQNVRKYSTTSIGRPVAESRRSSVTTKILESATRPSVSSSEDFTVMVGTSTESPSQTTPGCSGDRNNRGDEALTIRNYKKSASNVGRKRSSASSTTPIISVSSMADKDRIVGDTIESDSPALPKAPEAIAEKSEPESPTGAQAEGAGDAPAPSQQADSEPKGRNENENEICPWEDEESCKVDTPFVKTYATLGYL